MKYIFIRYILVLLTIVTLASSSIAQSIDNLPTTSHPTTDAYDGWKLGVQAYTFNRFTFFEAIDKTASLGLEWIEAYPGQRLSKAHPDVKFSHNMAPEYREEVKRKLKDAGIKLINYGVVVLPNNEEQSRKVFEFAKEMGIETIVSEPKEEALEMIDKLCQEYQIKMAIHNHPEPSHYWNPDVVLKAIKGRSNWIGANADTGHWVRSGVNPVEALKKLKGRIHSLHLKDLNEFGNKKAHDVVWGTGKTDVKAVLTELHNQGYQGSFSVEYEYNWENSLPDIHPSVAYFNEVASSLNGSGWKNLLKADLSNTTHKPGSWTNEFGVLERKGGGYIWTNEKYDDFILDLEYKVSKNANSGVFFRVASLRNFVQTSIEVQVHETTDGSKFGSNGSIYDSMGPSGNPSKLAGEWNHYTITAKDNMIWVVLNGLQIIEMDLNDWTTPHLNPDGTKNKFNTALKDMDRNGFMGFQDHGQPVWFRNIKVKELKK